MNDEIKISDEARECGLREIEEEETKPIGHHIQLLLNKRDVVSAALNNTIVEQGNIISQRDEEIRELRRDKERLQCLIDLVGSCRQCSDSDVKIFEDDATHNYFIETFSGERRTGQWFAQSVRGCLDAAMSNETKGGGE